MSRAMNDILTTLHLARLDFEDQREMATSASEFGFYCDALQILRLFIARQVAYEEWRATENAGLLGEIWACNDELRAMIGALE